MVDRDRSVYNDVPPYSDGVSSYITAAWGEADIYNDNVPQVLQVGNDGEFPAMGTVYHNVPLRSNTEYSILTRYDIRNEVEGGEVSGRDISYI